MLHHLPLKYKLQRGMNSCSIHQSVQSTDHSPIEMADTIDWVVMPKMYMPEPHLAVWLCLEIDF